MKAALVRGVGETPVYDDFEEPVVPLGENRIRVTAAALSPLIKSRASGKHYSSSGRFPFVAGVDAVGHLDDGRRVYFFLPKAPQGSMAEETVVPSAQCLLLPEEVDDFTAAAIANPGMSSWAAYMERARLKTGETASGSDITLPGSVLRSSPIELMGSGLGSISNDRLIFCIAQLLKAAGRGGFKIAANRAGSR